MAAVAQPSGAAAVLCPLLGTPRSGRLRRLPENTGTATGDPHRLRPTSARLEPCQDFTRPCHAQHRRLKHETLDVWRVQSSKAPAGTPELTGAGTSV